jgi:hypothetical protein
VLGTKPAKEEVHHGEKQTAQKERSEEAKEGARRNVARRAAGENAVTSKRYTGCS